MNEIVRVVGDKQSLPVVKLMPFDGVPLVVCIVADGTLMIGVTSILGAFPGIDRAPEWKSTEMSVTLVTARLGDGSHRTGPMISEADFVALMLTHPKCQPLRKWLGEVYVELRTGGAAFRPPAHLADDPRLQLAQVAYRNTYAIVEHEEELKRHDRAIEAIREDHEDTKNRLETVEQMIIAKNGRLFGIPYLMHRGWRIPDDPEARKKVGRELTGISKRFGDTPKLFKEAGLGGIESNTYLKVVFEPWEREYGHKLYPHWHPSRARR